MYSISAKLIAYFTHDWKAFLNKNVVNNNNFYVTLDIDECFLSIDDCHQSSNCININGSFLCLCDSATNGTLCQGK